MLCLCVVCIIGTGESDSPLLVDSGSTEHHLSNSINDVAILHHGVTQPVLHVCIGVALVMHCVADVCCPIQTRHGLPLIKGRAGDEVGSSGHVRFVWYATIIGTGSAGMGFALCHLANWLGRLTSLCYLVLQQLWIVFLCFCDQFIYSVLVLICVQVIIQYRHHCLAVHFVQDLLD